MELLQRLLLEPAGTAAGIAGAHLLELLLGLLLEFVLLLGLLLELLEESAGLLAAISC